MSVLVPGTFPGPVPSPPSPLAIWDTSYLLLLAWLDSFPISESLLFQWVLGCPCAPVVLDFWFCCGRGGLQGRTTPFSSPDFLCPQCALACPCLQTWYSLSAPEWHFAPPHGITGFPSVISGFSGVTPPVTWEVPPSPLLRGYSDISLLLSAWSTAAPGLPTQKPTSCIARPTRPPTHYKAMPPTTTRQVWAPILEGWGPSLSFKISDWLLKVPPLLIGLALGPGPLFATSPLIGCL